MSKSIHALYPGSFDVLTLGHLDVLRRAVRMFAKVTVAVADNPAKVTALFSPDERVEMLRVATKSMPNVEIRSFSGLTVDFARKVKATAILRGLRAVSDFEYELQMAMMNGNLAPEVTTVFMPPSPQYSFLSSSLVKEIARYGGQISELVPRDVERKLRRKLGMTK
ncbi:MAG: pantetheine-phosphate adenylyltransferase [Candidatus Sumerlaeaceae bacterium]|nr:pantetheine-phosphate adenylyltransferase [Candidatus Sumerlaeaceae bacterium]